MKIEKLPSGAYRVRKQFNGKRYSVIVPYEPTQKEALMLLSEEVAKDDTPIERIEPGSVGYYIDKYLAKLEKEDASPSTVRNYLSIKRNLSEKFKNLRFSEVTEQNIKDEVDVYKVERSAKTVRNMVGLLRSVFREYRPKFAYTVDNLPPKKKTAQYEPSTKDIQRIIEAAEGGRYECAYKCAVLGMRRGEFCAITDKDLDENNVLTIDKDLVLNKENKYIIKNKPKTVESYRRILIPKEVADLIRKQGCVYNGDPHSINKYLHTYQDRLGIPRFRLHMLRHFSAAYLHKQGFTDEQIKAFLGWSGSSETMQRVYNYNLDPEESQQDIASKFNSLL